MYLGRSVESFKMSISHQAALFQTQNMDYDFTSIKKKVLSASLKVQFFHVRSSLNMTH